VVESTDNKDLQKIYDAKNTTSLFDFNQLQRALGEVYINMHFVVLFVSADDQCIYQSIYKGIYQA